MPAGTALSGGGVQDREAPGRSQRDFSTKLLLREVKGQVWLTETGGILRLKSHDGSNGGRKYTKSQQANAVKRVYKIAKSSRRITRVYFFFAHS